MEFQQVFDLNKSPKTTPENNEINDGVTEEIPIVVAGRAPDKEARPADVQEVRIGYFSSMTPYSTIKVDFYPRVHSLTAWTI